MTVSTTYASMLGSSSIMLNGVLDDLHGETSLNVSFEWGDTISCANETTPESMSELEVFDALIDASTLDDFHTTGQIYFYRAKATDGVNIWRGIVRRFVCLFLHGSDPYVIDNLMSDGTLTNTDVFNSILLLDYDIGTLEKPEFAGASISSGIKTPVMESPEFAGASISGGTIT